MVESRTRNTLLNMVTGMMSKIISIILAFVVRTIFIKTLGIQYAGVSGVFTDILTILSFAELGIGSAIIYSLYKPIAVKDFNRISALMLFYKNIYRVISGVVFVLGMCLLPFLKFIITEVPDVSEDLRLIFILYIIKTSSSYLLIYKTTFLSAAQKDYVVAKYRIIISIVKVIIECVLLLVFYNFIIYLIFTIFAEIFQNYFIARKATKIFPNFKSKNVETLSKEDKRSIFKDVKAIFLYKVSGVVLTGTDSVVISSFLGTGLVGIVGNYNLITNQIYAFVMQIFTATSASVGNLAALESKESQYKVFRKLLFLCFWIYCFCATCLWTLLNPFILLWQGEERLLSTLVVGLLVTEFFIKGMLSPISSFRTSNGLFIQGKYRPLIMATLNIVISVVLVQTIGLPGVIIGTIVSRAATQLWYDPYLIYKRVFDKPVKSYYFKYTSYIIVTAFCCIITNKLAGLIVMENAYVLFLLKMCICIIVPNTILLLLFGRKYEFKELLTLVKSLIHRKGDFK